MSGSGDEKSVASDERSAASDELSSQSPTKQHPLAHRLSLLQVVVNAIRLYGAQHEQAHSRIEELIDSIQPLLEDLGALPLEVTHESINYEHKSVIVDRGPGGLVDTLYRDGIRTLTLTAGLSPGEFLELVTILGTNFNLPHNREDSLPGLLWAAELPHIQYESIEGLEEAVEDSDDAVRGENLDFGEICQRVFSAAPAAGEGEGGGQGGGDGDGLGPGEGGDGEDASEAVQLPMLPELPPEPEDEDEGIQVVDGVVVPATGSEAAQEEASGEDDALAATAPLLPSDNDSAAGALSQLSQGNTALGSTAWRGLASLDTVEFIEGRRGQLDVGPELLVGLWDEADADRFEALQEQVIAVLVHTLQANPTKLTGMYKLLQTLSGQAAESGLLSIYAETLDVVSQIARTDGGHSEAATLAGQLTTTQRLLSLVRKVDLNHARTAELLDHFLSIGGDQLIRDLLEDATEVTDPQRRQFLVTHLATALAQDTKLLTDNLRFFDAAHIRLRLEVLACMDTPLARDSLQALLTHSDPSIRTSVVQLIPGDYLRQILKSVVQMLADDRDSSVRCAIVARMEEESIPVLPGLIERMITAESFHGREFDEKSTILGCISRTDIDRARPLLISLLNGKVGLLAKEQGDSRRLAAITLGRYGGAGVRTELKRAAKSLNPGLRRAGQEGLREMERGRA